MANIKSAMKRHKQNLKRRARNRARKTRVKTRIKAVKNALMEKDIEKARDLLPKAMSDIQKAAQKGALHRNNASRKIARLSSIIHSFESQTEGD